MQLHYGVVENDWDPEALGRVQVRITGKHTENRTDPTAEDYIPVADLPWAQTLQIGTTISNESGGFAVPANGTVVVISFMDEEEQFPVILGSVPKLVEALPDFTQGFTDPNGINPSPESVGTSPISNYATGNPPPQKILDRAAETETTICVDNVWTEPTTPFAPVYPFNQVMQNGQNVLELDNTPGAERVVLQHTSGTFKEVHPFGTEVVKIKGENYIVVEQDQNILVKGGRNLTVRGLTDGYNTEASQDIKFKSSLAGFMVDTVTNIEMTSASGQVVIDAVLGTATMISSLNASVESRTANVELKGKVNATMEATLGIATVQGLSKVDIEATAGLVNITGPTSISIDTSGVLNIHGATALINIDGLCAITASLISLN